MFIERFYISFFVYRMCNFLHCTRTRSFSLNIHHYFRKTIFLHLKSIINKCTSTFRFSLFFLFSPVRRYELFGVITHTGLTLSHGHYTAFVRTREIRQMRPKNVKATADVSTDTQVPRDAPNLQNDVTKTEKMNSAPKDNIKCCDLEESCEEMPAQPPPQCDATSQDAPATDVTPVGSPPSQQVRRRAVEIPDDVDWCEFDDDRVTLLTETEFGKIIAPDSSNTPYMLFYRKVVRADGVQSSPSKDVEELCRNIEKAKRRKGHT